MKESFGILLYRRRPTGAEIFLVHPGGPFWASRDIGVWSIPKGEKLPDEQLLDAARREFHEETGLTADGDFHPLAPARQAGGKIVHAWAVEGDADAEAVVSNTFTTEWPPRSGRTQSFPEVDRAAWFDLATARRKIISGQISLIDELEQRLTPPGTGPN